MDQIIRACGERRSPQNLVARQAGELIIIGLTGGIGTGKTTVADYLRKKGLRVLDADRIARDLSARGSSVLLEIAKIFGQEALLPDGSLNRKKLAEIIFNQAEKKKQLDALMHARVFDVMLSEIEEAKREGVRVIFADVPLLFESGFERYTHEVWIVSADRKQRIERIMKRDGASEEEVLQRIRSQMDEEEKQKKSDHILNNAGERETLYAQIDALLEKIQD